MSDELRDLDAHEQKKASAGPFLLAVGIVGAILLAIVLMAVFSPAEKNVTESDLVSRTVTDYVDAENQKDTPTVNTLTCANFDTDAGPLVGADGKVELQGVDDVTFDGDTARADVRITGGGQGERVSSWTLTRSGDRWLVCN
ncbi:hypothetical protein ABH922_003631 [Rhodococcus sp. 27YEA15]|uniref:Rv0361 family membrane protein n=1 Tax=Rhodococcus sp. 27YEA15 TaxID=3156259 RepID=UPI003C7B46D6